MSINVSYPALALALLAGTSAANAQTVITRQITDQPVETVITQQPVVQTTTTTVRTTRRIARPIVRHSVVTTRRTVVSQRVLPAPVAANPQPLYDVVPAAPVVTEPAPVVATPAPLVAAPGPLYDEVAPPAAVDAAVVTQPPVVGAVPVYRYVYEPDRILVIDPTTNIAIQAIPR